MRDEDGCMRKWGAYCWYDLHKSRTSTIGNRTKGEAVGDSDGVTNCVFNIMISDSFGGIGS